MRWNLLRNSRSRWIRIFLISSAGLAVLGFILLTLSTCSSSLEGERVKKLVVNLNGAVSPSSTKGTPQGAPQKTPQSTPQNTLQHDIGAASSPANTPNTSKRELPPLLDVRAPLVLAVLESQGYGFGALVMGSAPGDHNDALAQTPRYRSIIKRLQRDLKELMGRDPEAGVGMKFGHRYLDPLWLQSKKLRYELVGVVNRIDRRPFEGTGCGEIRLIYRLGYSTHIGDSPVASRLPMTFNVVFSQDAEETSSCAAAAHRWRPPEATTPRELTHWLTSKDGPLHKSRLSDAQLKAVEVNMQSVRWPGTVHPSMAGHAEYIMRVFHLNDSADAFIPAPMENTPDVRRLKRNSKLRAEMLTWLKSKENLQAIEHGVFTLPNKFLAKRAVSLAPRGLARLGNRPFSMLYKAKDFADLDLSSHSYATSPAALLRRLDAMSCAGCHHSRSVAGFHLLGDEKDERLVDALQSSTSPHYHAEQTRRRADIDGYLAGTLPDAPRPFPERQLGGGPNEPCGLGDPGFKDWTCDAGLSCFQVVDDEVGVCQRASHLDVGDACERGRIKRNAHPHKDRVKDLSIDSCGPRGVCEINQMGFPGGMCARNCEDAGEHGTCGRIPLLVEFNRCIVEQRTFAECVSEGTRAAGMRACDDETPCRDDYICARAEGEQGACLPPYFLFQLRVDGHPI